MFAALRRFLDRFATRQLRGRLAYEPFPFVRPLEVLEAHVVGFVDSGAHQSNAGVWLGGLFISMGSLIGLAGLPARGGDLWTVAALATVLIGLGALLVVMTRWTKSMIRTLAYHEERRQVEITLWRRGCGMVARTTSPASECRVLLHPVLLGARRAKWYGFALMMHVKDDRFAIAAVKTKDEVLDLWTKLPAWVTAADGGEGEKLELVSDRRLW